MANKLGIISVPECGEYYHGYCKSDSDSWYFGDEPMLCCFKECEVKFMIYGGKCYDKEENFGEGQGMSDGCYC